MGLIMCVSFLIRTGPSGTYISKPSHRERRPGMYVYRLDDDGWFVKLPIVQYISFFQTFVCKVTPKILKAIVNIRYACDVIHRNDFKHYIPETFTEVEGNGIFILKDSDHIMVNCSGVEKIK